MRILTILTTISLPLTFAAGCSDNPKELLDAAAAGDTPAVVESLAKGTDVNAQFDGVTALMAAAYAGQEHTVRALLQHGANPNFIGPLGNTALMGAVARNQIAAAKILIAARADVNAKDDEGYTVLMIAVSNGFEDMVRLLIAAGADLKATDPNGQTALQWAEEYNHAGIVEALRTGGSKSAETAPITNVNNREYQDRKLGISFWYPATWEVMSPKQVTEKTRGLLDTKGSVAFVINPDDTDQNVIIKSYKVTADALSPRALKNLERELDAENAKRFQGFRKISSAIIPVTGVNALAYTQEVNRDTIILRQRSVLLVKDGADYVLTFTAPKDRFSSADRKCFQVVQSTFQVK